MGFLLCSMLDYACLLGPFTCTSFLFFLFMSFFFTFNTFMFTDDSQIPDKVLERRPHQTVRDSESSSSPPSPLSDDESAIYIVQDDNHNGQNGRPKPRPRRLSTYEDANAVMDPENCTTNGTSRRWLLRVTFFRAIRYVFFMADNQNLWTFFSFSIHHSMYTFFLACLPAMNSVGAHNKLW
jgi:hypothetical protein